MTEVHPPAGADPIEHGGDLGATIASRICHDVASPLGAIANGVELLMLAGLERTPELDLVIQSVEGASARLRFLRLAFGAPRGRDVGEGEVASLLAGIEKTSRFAYRWAVPGDVPREEAKAAFLLLLCCESALPLGGALRVGREGGAWEVTAEGPRLRVLPALWAALGPERAPPPDAAALVQFALLPGALDLLGRRLDLSLGDDRIVARF